MKATYVKTQLKSFIDVSKIITIHYYEFDKKFVFDGESHDFWEMVYVDKGRVKVFSNEKEIILSQGEIIFHQPNEFHSIRAYDSEPNFFVISFVSPSPAMQYFVGYSDVLDKTLKGFISSIVTESENTYVIPKNDPTLKKLKKRENADLGGEQLIKTYLEQLLILLIRKQTKRGEIGVFPNKESMENHLVVAVKDLITRKMDENLRISDICSELGYSKSYISKLFKEQTGDTIASFGAKVRINRAKELIREGVMNFSEISDMLDFDNPQYFSRVFKRETGMTPSEFKHSLNFRR